MAEVIAILCVTGTLSSFHDDLLKILIVSCLVEMAIDGSIRGDLVQSEERVRLVHEKKPLSLSGSRTSRTSCSKVIRPSRNFRQVHDSADVFDAEASGKSSDLVILSESDLVILSGRRAVGSRAMIAGVRKHLRDYAAAFSSVEYDLDKNVDGTGIKAPEVKLPVGKPHHESICQPRHGPGLFRQRFFRRVRFPLRQQGNLGRCLPRALLRVEVLGDEPSPNCKGNKFCDLLLEQNDDRERHTSEIYRAVADGLPHDEENHLRILGDEDARAKELEYELKWLDDVSAWIPFDLIRTAETHHESHRRDSS